MTAFRNIVKLTILYSLRSYIFQILLVLLAICSLCLPFLISGDGTPVSLLRITIDYSLAIITTILIISSIWLSCTIMSSDIESYRIHMITVKPIHKYTIWLGKFCGILLIHSVLLVVALSLVYLSILWKIQPNSLPKQDLNELKEKVLIARKTFYPKIPDIQSILQERVDQQINEQQRQGTHPSTEDIAQLQNNLRFEILAQKSRTEPKKSITFRFSRLPLLDKADIILHYRLFIGDVDLTDKQDKPRALGFWYIKNSKTGHYIPLTKSPENIISNFFIDQKLPENTIDLQGNVFLKFKNLDPSRSIFFQLAEGPQLRVKYTGFTINYIKAAFISFLGLLLIIGLGCSISGLLSLPIAVFTVAAYLIFGSLSTYIISTAGQEQDPDASEQDSKLQAQIGYYVSSSLLKVIIPIQSFDASDEISSGKLIEINSIWQIIKFYILFKGLPVFLLCIYFYSKRELGLVTKNEE